MSSRKCPTCGLVSFAGAESCKRCKAGNSASPRPTTSETSSRETETSNAKSRSSISPLRILLFVLLLALPGMYYYRAQQRETIAQEKKATEAEKVDAKAEEESWRKRCGEMRRFRPQCY